MKRLTSLLAVCMTLSMVDLATAQCCGEAVTTAFYAPTTTYYTPATTFYAPVRTVYYAPTPSTVYAAPPTVYYQRPLVGAGITRVGYAPVAYVTPTAYYAPTRYYAGYSAGWW